MVRHKILTCTTDKASFVQAHSKHNLAQLHLRPIETTCASKYINTKSEVYTPADRSTPNVDHPKTKYLTLCDFRYNMILSMTIFIAHKFL